MGVEITRLQCNVCGVWVRENYLAKHVKSHNAKVETCSICSKLFQNRKSLCNHMRNMHGNRAYQCAVCGKAFQKTLSLKVSYRMIVSKVFSVTVIVMFSRSTWHCTRVKTCINVRIVQKHSSQAAICMRIERRRITTSGKRTVESVWLMEDINKTQSIRMT